MRMRLTDDVRRIVAFLGVADDTPGKGGIACLGTGFFLYYDQYGYFVTAKHVAHAVRDVAYLVRMNMRDGTSVNVNADGLEWHDHPDPAVDVSVAGFFVEAVAGMTTMYLPDAFVLRADAIESGVFGIGDLTYTVGLFRLLSGMKRNLPIVHAGSIALVPGDEKIPVRDWETPGNVLNVDGYLVEANSLSGLSGAPVFVRRSIDIDIKQPDDRRESGRLPESQVFLLGLWQGAWDAPPDEVMAAEFGRGVRVPVGLGIVVPAYRILEVLDLPQLKERRRLHKEEMAAKAHDEAATPEVATVRRKSQDEANPDHREDFKRLLGAAVKRPKSSD